VTTRGFVSRAAVVLGLLAAWPEAGRAGPGVVELKGWADVGVAIPGHGLGPDLFLLTAEAEWDRAAPGEPSRYAIRVVLPDGRAETRPFPVNYPPGRRRFAVYIPASAIRNRAPSAVRVGVSVVDAATGATLSNDLPAGIEQFPRPRGDVPANDTRPYGWGEPLSGGSGLLPGEGPDGLRFARIPASGAAPGFYLATSEATVRQVGDRIKGYDPRAGRSDEFSLEGPAQPAINLTPARAIDYLKAIGQADPSGVSYRLPTRDEWTRAAVGGKASAFWWGDGPAHPEGANFLGAEPGQAGDATAPSVPPEGTTTFQANPIGLFHTFGNVAEWATDPSGGFGRMGGHFRTEPASPLPGVKVDNPEELGPDPFVGVRPALDLSPEAGAAIARRRLAGDPRLAGVVPTFDPDRAAITLTGTVAEASARRSADKLLEPLWFVATVENRLETPGLGAGQLASLGAPAGPPRRVASLGRKFLEVPLSVRWLDPLPAAGSDWFVNIYLPGGGHLAHKLAEVDPGRSARVLVVVDRDRLAAAGLGDDAPMTVALSLGAPAEAPADPRVVSNQAPLRPAPRP